MLKNFDDVSETLFNVLDKVCTTSEARKTYFDPLIVNAFVTQLEKNQISMILQRSILNALIMHSISCHYQHISILT